jgi:hypothetical protein
VWDFPEEEFDVGFRTLPGGSRTADQAPGVTFSEGIQFLLKMRGEGDSQLFINSGYDYHTWLYAEWLRILPRVRAEADVSKGEFLPWRLLLKKALTLPQSREGVPYEEFDVGVMRPGTTNPEDPAYDSLADWFAEGEVLEIQHSVDDVGLYGSQHPADLGLSLRGG